MPIKDMARRGKCANYFSAEVEFAQGCLTWQQARKHSCCLRSSIHGISYAAHLAEYGFDVLGVDTAAWRSGC
jgi:hypothetical protein